ncbi:MAG: EAL domain-containing protein, partial [Sedimentibacter sp.]
MSEQFKEAVSYIIENKQIKTVFQPIISLRDGSILGHEALSRIICESEIENTEMLFKVAGQHNRLWELELLCRTTALEAAYKFMIPPYSKKLFINVNPNIMHDEAFKKGFT